jgi:N-acetylmuramoyl-L-alanine amidase
MLKKLLCIFVFLSIQAFAQVNITNIDYSGIGNNKYKVTLSFDSQIKHNITNEEKQVIIDFSNTNISLEGDLKKLDGKFLKSIVQQEDQNKNLRLTFNLAENCAFLKSYTVSHNNLYSLTFEIINKSIQPSLEKKKESTKKLQLKKLVVMIDPGHGGNDKGTMGIFNKTLEKDLVLAYAKELRKELKRYPQYEVILSRDKDEFISSEARRELAKKRKADLFISLHADFNNDKTLKGASIYTLSQEGMEKQASAILEQENKANILKNEELLKKNKSIANILLSIVYQNTNNASIYLAKAITEFLKKDIDMLQNPNRAAELKVLKGVDTPAILVELGFLSNKDEEILLNDTKHKKIFTQALVQGLNKYFESLKNATN